MELAQLDVCMDPGYCRNMVCVDGSCHTILASLPHSVPALRASETGILSDEAQTTVGLVVVGSTKMWEGVERVQMVLSLKEEIVRMLKRKEW